MIYRIAVVYYNKLMENLKEFEAKFTCLLQNQDVAIKNDLRDMSAKLNVLSEEIVVFKSQQIVVNAETVVGSVDKDILAPTKKSSNQSTTMAHCAKGTTCASLEKPTDDLHESEKCLPSSIQPAISRSEELVTKNIMGVVTEVLGKEGAPSDAHVTKKGGAQPKEKFRVSFTPPTFGLGLTQEGVSLAKNAAKEATTKPGDVLKRNLTTKQRSKKKVPQVQPSTTIPAAKQSKRSLIPLTR
ncbi:unnamed protein product [Arabis nemorensis]|uniref:Uncharacterized protein n=1 Tax=Arabis nemorensis TaxID=586526 RepID=A0A565BIY0_9BRAS|nr:unnamed protein product [Arabis nemorensis]